LHAPLHLSGEERVCGYEESGTKKRYKLSASRSLCLQSLLIWQRPTTIRAFRIELLPR
jgi:hypothetical protein